MSGLHLILGDITGSHADIIVNAANCSLLGGGGVDGAIHSAAGPELLAYCRSLADIKGTRCQTGEAVLTPAFSLNAKHIIHTVGPIYQQHSKTENTRLLANCYLNSLTLAMQVGASSIAFPAISAGIYGYPMAEAAEVAINNCNKFSMQLDISFYLYDQSAYKIWQQKLQQVISSK